MPTGPRPCCCPTGAGEQLQIQLAQQDAGVIGGRGGLPGNGAGGGLLEQQRLAVAQARSVRDLPTGGHDVAEAARGIGHPAGFGNAQVCRRRWGRVRVSRRRRPGVRIDGGAVPPRSGQRGAAAERSDPPGGGGTAGAFGSAGAAGGGAAGLAAPGSAGAGAGGGGAGAAGAGRPSSGSAAPVGDGQMRRKGGGRRRWHSGHRGDGERPPQARASECRFRLGHGDEPTVLPP